MTRKIKRRTCNKYHGGAAISKKTRDNDKGAHMVKGLLMQLKLAVAERIAMLVNGPITQNIRDRFLTGFPEIVRVQLSYKLDKIAVSLVKDMSTKGLSVLENLLRATPGVGNAYSLVAAVDNAIAAARNVRNAFNKIAVDIEKAKQQMREMGLNPDDYGIPSIPQLETPAIFTDAAQKMTDIANQAQAQLAKSQEKLQMQQVPQIQPQPSSPMAGGRPRSGYPNILARTKKSVQRFHNSTRRLRGG